MAKKTNYLTVQRKDGTWTVKSSNTTRKTLVYHSKAEAWKETRRLARGAGSIAILRGSDGKISAQNTYDMKNNSPQKLSAN